MRGQWIRGVVVGLLLSGALTACGEKDSTRDTDARKTPAPTPIPTESATAESDGSMVPPLPDPSRTPKATSAPAGRTFGADISWPQCPKGMGIPEKRGQGQPMPTKAAKFVVLGLTNGPSFVANPCLASQVQWVKDRRLMAAAYAVLSYPNRRTVAELRDDGPFAGDSRMGALRNVGYQAALFNVATMNRVGLTTPVVWIDVEPVTDFEWSSNPEANAAVVQGAAKGYGDAGFRVGFYSIGSLWTRVVGSLRLRAPEWRPAGERGLGEALARCRDDWSFQGGPGVLGQWLQGHRDHDVTCPGRMPDLTRWFHQY